METRKPLRIAVLGVSGRMGKLVARLALTDPELTLTAAMVSPGSTALHADAGVLCGAGPSNVICSTDLDGAISRSDVIIDFSTPASTLELVRHAVRQGRPALVIGTTGIEKQEAEEIEQAARLLPVLRSANMSQGVNVLLGLAGKVSQALADFDVEIVELHHRMKQDAPSGTALMLGQEIAQKRELDPEAVIRSGRAGRSCRRTDEELGLAAVRGGDVIGEHTVYFMGAGERIELVHRATSREIFAHGAIRAARWLAGQPAGSYDMRDVLGLK